MDPTALDRQFDILERPDTPVVLAYAVHAPERYGEIRLRHWTIQHTSDHGARRPNSDNRRSGSLTTLLVGFRLPCDFLGANMDIAGRKFVVGIEAVWQIGEVVDTRPQAFGVAVWNRRRDELRHDVLCPD